MFFVVGTPRATSQCQWGHCLHKGSVVVVVALTQRVGNPQRIENV